MEGSNEGLSGRHIFAKSFYLLVISFYHFKNNQVKKNPITKQNKIKIHKNNQVTERNPRGAHVLGKAPRASSPYGCLQLTHTGMDVAL